MRLLMTLTLAALLGAAPPAADTPAEYTDPIHGFSVAVPRLGAAGGPVQQRLMVFGATRNGFAPNCNVQIQSIEMTLEAFMNLTEQQLAGAGLELVDRSARTVSNQAAETFEYSGPMNGRQLRWLALAVEGDGRFWVLTCTGLADGFEDLRGEYEAVIESFRVRDNQSQP